MKIDNRLCNSARIPPAPTAVPHCQIRAATTGLVANLSSTRRPCSRSPSPLFSSSQTLQYNFFHISARRTSQIHCKFGPSMMPFLYRPTLTSTPSSLFSRLLTREESPEKASIESNTALKFNQTEIRSLGMPEQEAGYEEGSEIPELAVTLRLLKGYGWR